MINGLMAVVTDRETSQVVGMNEPAHQREVQFPLTMDRPAGRTDCVVSAVTKQPLRYFTPDPLSDLLSRCSEIQKQRPAPANDGMAFMLARIASVRGINGDVDATHAKRFCNLIAKRLQIDTYSDLLKLGSAISSRNRGLREEIMFSGGYIASSARTVFAPHALLPSLMKELLLELQERKWRDVDPALATAIAGFYCVSSHPFMDGNGRWSRLVAAAYGMSAGNTLTPMINVVFQNIAKADLVSNIWSSTRGGGGIRTYAEASWRFEDAFLSALEASNVFNAATNISSEFASLVSGRRAYQDVMITLGSEGSIPLMALRTLFGQSQQAHEGMLERLHEAGNGFAVVADGRLSLQPLHIEIAQAAAKAVHEIFNGESI